MERLRRIDRFPDREAYPSPELLAADDTGKARLVELHSSAGLSTEEASKTLCGSAITAKRYWRYAKGLPAP